MTDITKCMGLDCPKKETCYRYTAKANEFWQSYLAGPPIWDKTLNACEHYWKNYDETD